ncbi:TPA: hypothetical protein ACH3X3_012541 [Trebouxia sp. C0006]
MSYRLLLTSCIGHALATSKECFIKNTGFVNISNMVKEIECELADVVSGKSMSPFIMQDALNSSGATMPWMQNIRDCCTSASKRTQPNNYLDRSRHINVANTIEMATVYSVLYFQRTFSHMIMTTCV